MKVISYWIDYYMYTFIIVTPPDYEPPGFEVINSNG